MVAYASPRSLSFPAAEAAAILGGGLVALALLAMPNGAIEQAVMDSGLPRLIAAARPPLGLTARVALVLLLGGGTSLGLWLVGRLMFGKLRVLVPLPHRAPRAAQDPGAPTLRRADAHPDAPARAPVLALRDLGTPFLDVKAPVEPAVTITVEKPLPADLDQPMAAFDPDALPEVPASPPQPLRPLFRVAPRVVEHDGEAVEGGDLATTFAAEPLAPPVMERAPEPPIAAPETDASVGALLERLERGLARRAGGGRLAVAPSRGNDGEGLQATLASLRRLATSS